MSRVYARFDASRGGNKMPNSDTRVTHGRSRMTIYPSIPKMPGRSTSATRQTLLAPSAKRREVLGESHKG